MNTRTAHLQSLAAGQGVEPHLPGSEPDVLPLDEPAVRNLLLVSLAGFEPAPPDRETGHLTISTTETTSLLVRPVGLEPTPRGLKGRCSAARATDAFPTERIWDTCGTWDCRLMQISTHSEVRLRSDPPFSAPATTAPCFEAPSGSASLLLVPSGGLEPPPHGVRIRCAAPNTSKARHFFGSPTGNRTPVSGLKGQRPRR